VPIGIQKADQPGETSAGSSGVNQENPDVQTEVWTFSFLPRITPISADFFQIRFCANL
jgi:hypothetical protein